MLYFLLGFILGIVIGTVLFRVFRPKRFGALRVDQSDPDDTYIFFELHRSLDDLKRQKRIIVDVCLKDFIPHK